MRLHLPRRTGCLPALAVAAALAAWRVQPVAASPLDQRLQAYVATPAHQAETVKAARSSGRWQVSDCKQAQPFGASQIIYSSARMGFAPDGTPSSGLWMERVMASGCGPDVLLNVAWLVRDGRVMDGPMAPGGTRADPVLQTDAARILLPLAQAKAPGCSGSALFIYDTVMTPAAPGDAPGRWNERWTIAACAKRVTIPISFMPDGGGGTDIAVRGEDAVVQ